MSPTLGELATAVLQKKYEKPTTGIPLNDLEDNALDDYATKADTVLTTTLSRGRKANTTIGTASIAFGNNVEASGNFSHAEGNSTTASGNVSHTEGQQTFATGLTSHAEGASTQATGNYSHTEGRGTITTASYSHASGKYNIADSHSSWPEWVASTSYAVGDKVKITNGTTITGYVCKTANSDASFTASKWTEDAKMNYVEIVGNGADDNARSNARALDWDGNEHLMGDVYVGCNADSSGGIKLARLGDVQINGTSIVNGGVANIPYASTNNLGVIKVSNGSGLSIDTEGTIMISRAGSSYIKTGTNTTFPIVPSSQHQSVFYGLSKAAGVDLASATVTVGTYPETSKSAIRTMLGATSSNVIAVQDEQPTDSDTKIWLPETAETPVEVPTVAEMNAALAGKVGDVQVNGTSVVSNGTANVPVASTSTFGAVKIGNGLFIDSNNKISTSYAQLSAIKTATDYYSPLTPYYQHAAAFYGLAKAAGDTTQASSANAVGTYTNDAKTAIQTMLGVPGDVQINGSSIVSNGVANIPVCSSSAFGVVKVDANSFGIKINNEGKLYTDTPSAAEIKAGTQAYKPITPVNQYSSTFYGLAKAAGDATQSASSNAVGTYTSEAKAAIKSMLGVEGGMESYSVSGTTPSITALANTRYVCGEVSTISITPCALGTTDIIFTSGSSATILTIPATVKFPVWFDATALETDTIYEICITDGTYGSVMTWPNS